MADHARNISREAYLWYTITSPKYIDRARDHLQNVYTLMSVDVRDDSSNLVNAYPPIAHWGNTILTLLSGYSHARALLHQGEFSAISFWSQSLMDIPRGLRESVTSWMKNADNLWSELDAAYGICSRFSRALTMSMMYSDQGYLNKSKYWQGEIPEDLGIPGDHIARYSEEYILPDIPHEIPEYMIDKAHSCKTGEIVPWTGVWVPTAGMGKAALAFARQGVQIMQPAYQLILDDEETGEEEYALEDTLWHPVKPTGRMMPYPSAKASASTMTDRLRCEAGQPCPREGWWFTPALTESRQHFIQGQTMPEAAGDYGLTIWLWDARQE